MGLRGALGKVSGAANGLLAKAGYALAGRWIKQAAEGQHGPTPKAIYWALAGKKRLLGGLLGLVCAVSMAVGGHDVVTWVSGALSALLVGVGLLDAKWRDDLGWQADLRGWAVYRILAEHASLNTILLATLWAFVQAGYCTEYVECATASKVLLGAAAAAVYLGLVDAAWLTTPPAVVPQKKEREA